MPPALPNENEMKCWTTNKKKRRITMPLKKQQEKQKIENKIQHLKIYNLNIAQESKFCMGSIERKIHEDFSAAEIILHRSDKEGATHSSVV